MIKSISILEKIIQSGAIDSIKLTKALEELIATLNKNKSGSYFSMRSTWDFTTSLIKNYVRLKLVKISGLETLLEALDKTLSDAGLEVQDVIANMKNAMEEKYGGEFPFLFYDEKKALPEPQATHAADQIEQS